MENAALKTTRRALLGVLTAGPVAALPCQTIAAPWRTPIDALHQRYEDEPAEIRRSAAGRSLSAERYQTAREYFDGNRDAIGDTSPG
ncbi:MAG TPA: hypothetical protein VF503_14535 [Sphingobium sp.]|uniref:hypothetical protein n=1 Tax=Sphingobium sp. TaxID=1912891 RepID=UPI002ED2B404